MAYDSTKEKDPKAESLIKRYDKLKGDRSSWDTLWQQIADYVQPRKSQITDRKTPDVTGYTDELYNLTAVRACQILASGQMDYLFSGQWFSYDAPAEIEADDAKTWFQRTTEITMRELARSNWTLELHEMLLDRGAFGTAAVHCEAGTRRPLVFTKFDVGEFCAAEDHEGQVDTLMREFELTARQALQKFGEKALGKKLLKAAMDESKQDEKFCFIHAIYPRADNERNASKVDPMNKPIASCYVCKEDRNIVQEGGYDETPFAVSRFLKWGKEVYGYSPSIEALPTVRQVNFIEKNWDALSELKAFPRVLIPEGMEGDVDLRAGGATTFDPNIPAGMPQEWGTLGDDRQLAERVRMKDEAIREAYHVDLFQMLQQIERQMTAYEVSQRLAEKVTAFSPTFYRLQTEVINPLLARVFAILFRAGKFGDPPESAFVPVGDGKTAALAMPEITLTGKLAMAIRAAENNAFAQLIQILAPLMEVAPEIIDNYDLDKAARGIGKNLSVPTDWQREEADRDNRREQRAQQQAQQAAIAEAQGAAKAAKDASAASPEVRRAVMGG